MSIFVPFKFLNNIVNVSAVLPAGKSKNISFLLVLSNFILTSVIVPVTLPLNNMFTSAFSSPFTVNILWVAALGKTAVSYTHLTLPTSDLV